MQHKLCGSAALCLLIGVIGVAFSGGGALAASDPTPTPVPTLAPVVDPVPGQFDQASVADLDLTAYPIIPEISEQARLIYLDGVQRGNNLHTFIKVGDCMTANLFFLVPIGEGTVDLGDYTNLASVIEQFIDGDLNSFTQESQAAAGGFNTASVLDTLWANPQFCQSGETPLQCEFRIMQPSIAVIMFGTNDVQYLTAEQFDFSLRSILAATIRNGTLPLLSTFPDRPEFLDQSRLFNQIIVKAALDYDIPLINLWLALEPLPDHGVDPEDTTHLTEPKDGSAADFTPANLETGFTLRNLVTLQALEAVLEAVREE